MRTEHFADTTGMGEAIQHFPQQHEDCVSAQPEGVALQGKAEI
jgi:hypothetical protein